MKVTYDPMADAMYIYLSNKKKSTRTEEVGDGLLADFSGEKLVGIEILDVSKKLPKKDLNTINLSLPIYKEKILKQAM